MFGWRKAQALTPLLATALVALLALAGPATAKTGSHHGDDDPAGTIASYDEETNKLTIDLADGGSVSGLVTSRTWIDDGDRGCRDGGDEGDASRKARSAGKGSGARHGDWCHERRNGDHDGDGDRHGWWRHNGEESDLVAGAVVEDAILVLKDGKAWFAKVELED
jgi:hypothetical protein